MKLYYHPVSTTSRPIMLFAAEAGIPLDYQVVDLFTGEHMGDAYGAINPSRLVPVLEDGDFRLTESSAILKYLADKVGSAAYPKDLKQRARVNEMMDWLNTGLMRDYAYGLVYPQVFPHLRREDERVQAGTVAWGKERAKQWLTILDRDLIGPGKRFLCGDAVTIADYFGAALLTAGETVGCSFKDYPNIARWLAAMKALPSWSKVHEIFDGLVGSMKDKAFERI
jgi:glutathione S-transferase